MKGNVCYDPATGQLMCGSTVIPTGGGGGSPVTIDAIDLVATGNPNEIGITIDWTDSASAAQTTTDPTPVTLVIDFSTLTPAQITQLMSQLDFSQLTATQITALTQEIDFTQLTATQLQELADALGIAKTIAIDCYEEGALGPHESVTSIGVGQFPIVFANLVGNQSPTSVLLIKLYDVLGGNVVHTLIGGGPHPNLVSVSGGGPFDPSTITQSFTSVDPVFEAANVLLAPADVNWEVAEFEEYTYAAGTYTLATGPISAAAGASTATVTSDPPDKHSVITCDDGTQRAFLAVAPFTETDITAGIPAGWTPCPLDASTNTFGTVLATPTALTTTNNVDVAAGGFYILFPDGNTWASPTEQNVFATSSIGEITDLPLAMSVFDDGQPIIFHSSIVDPLDISFPGTVTVAVAVDGVVTAAAGSPVVVPGGSQGYITRTGPSSYSIAYQTPHPTVSTEMLMYFELGQIEQLLVDGAIADQHRYLVPASISDMEVVGLTMTLGTAPDAPISVEIAKNGVVLGTLTLAVGILFMDYPILAGLENLVPGDIIQERVDITDGGNASELTVGFHALATLV